MKLPLTYAILAFIATCANIAAQDIALHLHSGPWDVVLSVIVGTGTGLVTKYVLDKKYIFGFRARDAAHDGRTFALYTLTGIVTTLVFWGFEFGFDYVFASKTMRYVGAVIGLAIGYFMKYRLDRQFVFRTEAA
ncbi:MAG TPA: GtrA family protein [Ramlibacter sp.]|nr:GtrA family protein [Ramlibacter sp.]